MEDGELVRINKQEFEFREKERLAHEFRAGKRADSPFVRAALRVMRSVPTLWQNINLNLQEDQEVREIGTALPGETHRISADLTAKIYRNDRSAALYDTALFDSTKAESRFFKEQIRRGNNYTPVLVVGEGGVYGTIFSAAFLKENPKNPSFGVDAGARRGGIWGISGDVVLQPFWRMNSRNRKEDKEKDPIPGTIGNLNSLGAEVQNLEVPDISSSQYPTNNELGRVLSHDNFLSNNIIVDSELLHVRLNQDGGQNGKFQLEFVDKTTRERYFIYTDIITQASGLGEEDLGFSDKFSSTREALEKARRTEEEGVRTPELLTFLALVEAATSNRANIARELKRFGLEGKGDTSKIIREYFIGIGGIDPGVPAQLGFTDEVIVFGQEPKKREQLAPGERARYIQGLLEFERADGSFFRVKTVGGRVVGVGIPKQGDGILVYYRRTDKTPDGDVVTITSQLVPRLVTAAGFNDKSDRIYASVNPEVIREGQIAGRLDEIKKSEGATIFYRSGGEFARAEIKDVMIGGSVEIILIGSDGNSISRMVGVNSEEISELLDPTKIERVELLGKAPSFESVIDPKFDDEIPIAEKAVGLPIYKIGACTNLPITEKERRKTKAYRDIPENSKSIFRFVRRTVFFARKLASEVGVPTSETLNLERYSPRVQELSDINAEEPDLREVIRVQLDPKTKAQELPITLNGDDLLRYLVDSRLDYVFPANLKQLSFGIKREGQDSLTIEPSIALPMNGGWEAIDRFFQDPLTQRLLLALTRETSGAAEVRIGLSNRRVVIGEVSAKAIRLNSVKEFREKYPRTGALSSFLPPGSVG